MAEHLNRYARLHEIVPVETYRQGGVEGWLFRDREHKVFFVSQSDLEAMTPVRRES